MWGFSVEGILLPLQMLRCISRVAFADNHPKRTEKKACAFLRRLLPSPTEGWGLKSTPGFLRAITGHWCAYSVLGIVCPAKRAAVACISTGRRVKCLTAQKSQKKRFSLNIFLGILKRKANAVQFFPTSLFLLIYRHLKHPNRYFPPLSQML